ncbi:hypothetical protein, partial [Aliarcobacter vitoriensis]
GYGPEDTVYVVIDGTKELWESQTGEYVVKLVDKDGNVVVPTKDTDVVVKYTNKTTQDGDTEFNNNATIKVTIKAGSSEAKFTVETIDDYLADNGEIYNVAIDSVDDKGQFEKVTIGDIEGKNKEVDTTILDNSNPNNPGEPDNPLTPGDNPGYGPEDTVYV